jgi:hypothetical protein
MNIKQLGRQIKVETDDLFIEVHNHTTIIHPSLLRMFELQTRPTLSQFLSKTYTLGIVGRQLWLNKSEYGSVLSSSKWLGNQVHCIGRTINLNNLKELNPDMIYTRPFIPPQLLWVGRISPSVSPT